MGKEIERFIEKKIPKGFLLQSQGDTKLQGYYVKKGLLRSSFIDNNGKEHTYMFAPENWVISDFSIITNIKTVVLSIEALEESEIILIPSSVMENLHLLPNDELIVQIQRFMKRISALQERVLLLMSATAEERYLHFMKTYPDIPQRVPQKMIASYLGITPEALSRVRKSIKK